MQKINIKKFNIMLCLFFISLYLIGCTFNSKTNIISEDLKNASPQKLVEIFYNSLSKGDYKTAKSCLSTDYAKEFSNAPDSDFKNLLKITDIKVSAEAPIKLYNKNYDEVQVTAEYTAEYKKVITAENGKQLRFIYVAKMENDSSWKIISIGTGP